MDGGAIFGVDELQGGDGLLGHLHLAEAGDKDILKARKVIGVGVGEGDIADRKEATFEGEIDAFARIQKKAQGVEVKPRRVEGFGVCKDFHREGGVS